MYHFDYKFRRNISLNKSNFIIINMLRQFKGSVGASDGVVWFLCSFLMNFLVVLFLLLLHIVACSGDERSAAKMLITRR